MMDMDTKKIDALKALIEKSDNIVFYGGAGVSTESGLKDFRSERGIYAALERYGHPPETLLHRDFFRDHPDIFYKYYRDLMVAPNAAPNAAHRALAELERQGKLKAVITQNIDGLHQMAGSKTVLELHGSMHRNYCVKCKKQYPLSAVMEADGVPLCSCGGTIRPDIVLYGEFLDERTLQEAAHFVEEASLMIVGGTSLQVYPAAGFVRQFSGDTLVIINKTPTDADARASLVIHAPIGSVLGQCV